VAHTELAAKGAISPAEDGEVSRELAAGGTADRGESSALAPRELGLAENAILRPQPGSLSNHVEVMADAGTRDRLVKQVEHFMLSNRIPDLRSVKEPAPIQEEQSFYYIEDAAGRRGGAVPADGDSSDGSVEIVLNASAPQVERLVESMQDVVEKERGNVAWTANAVNISGADSATQVMQQLSSNRVNEPSGHVAAAAPPAAKAAVEKAQWQAKADESKGEVGESEAVAQSGPRARGESPLTPGAGGGKRAGRIGNAGAVDQEERAVKNEDFITVAISFRLQKPSVQQTTPVEPLKPAAGPTTSAPGQSQSTLPGGSR
jgi:acylphosphatase